MQKVHDSLLLPKGKLVSFGTGGEILEGSNPGICGVGRKAKSGEIQILNQDGLCDTRYILFFGNCLFGVWFEVVTN